MKKATLGLTRCLLVVAAIGCGGGVRAQSVHARPAAKVPAVAMYAEAEGRGTSLSIVLDPEGSNLLTPGVADVITLSQPSEDLEIATIMIDGKLLIEPGEKHDDDKDYTTTYGSWTYVRVTSQLDGQATERIIAAFRRQGSKEKAFGAVNGQIFSIDGDTNLQIGQESFRDVITPGGEHRRLRMVRLQGPGQKWMTDLDGKIMQEAADGKLVQAGWVGWRKIADPQGKRLHILMVKSMAPGAKWSGHYGGKLYHDK